MQKSAVGRTNLSGGTSKPRGKTITEHHTTLLISFRERKKSCSGADKVVPKNSMLGPWKRSGSGGGHDEKKKGATLGLTGGA